MTNKGFPNPEDVQKEFERFVKDRFGQNVQVVAQSFGAPPQAAGSESPPPPEVDDASPLDQRLQFDLQPKQVKAHLDRFVIGQDEAKKTLAIAVCDHYNHIRESLRSRDKDDFEYTKQNVLILGPTGVGKSYLIKQLAKLIGVPFVKADATRFSETGYVGANVDDLVKDLVKQADDDLNLAQYGIIYLDEADKLAGGSQSGRDVSGRGVQFGLLKLMEETEVDLRGGNDVASQMQAFMDFQRKGKVERQVINTKNILFIVSGAFSGLEEIIAERLNTNRIGFDADLEEEKAGKKDYFRYASTNDFLKYGFEPEFIGRLPVRVDCKPLEIEELTEILRSSEGSIIRQYQRAFAAYGIKVEFSDDALTRIAELAYEQNTGARALLTVCEGILRDYKFELPDRGVQHLTITKDVIDSPRNELEKLLAQRPRADVRPVADAVHQYAQEFASKHHMNLFFTDKMIEVLAEQLDYQATQVKDFLDKSLQSYEHGLKLIQQNTGLDRFELNEEVVGNPRGLLERLIRESYSSVQHH